MPSKKATTARAGKVGKPAVKKPAKAAAPSPAADRHAKLKKNLTATTDAAVRLTVFLEAAVRGAQINLASHHTLAKLYEVEVATDFMRRFLKENSGNRIELAGHFKDPGNALAVPAGTLASKGSSVTIVIPGKPELPRSTRHTSFKLVKASGDEERLWLSIRFQTRNSVESNVSLVGIAEEKLYGHVTELDVGVFRGTLVDGVPPSYELLSLAASCKLTACSRGDVSNAEFLRAVTARSTGRAIAASRAAWAAPDRVPADPPIPVYLASSSATLTRWEQPLEAVGLYCRKVSF